DHASSIAGLVGSVVMLTGIVSAVGVLLWARGLLPIWLIGALFGLGMLASSVLNGEGDNANPWKFGVGFPVMVIVLALLSRPGLRVAEAVALLVFAVVALGTDSRYRFATLMITAVLVFWQMLPRFRSRRASTLTMLAMVAAIAAITYNLATALIVDGYLGEQAQSRTIGQLEKSGSLILGGRPELAATIALFQERPFGFGAGVQPTLDDILVAKTGMSAIGYQPNNGYVETYLFGGGFELHSVAGDLWASFGLPGLAFVICAIVLALHMLGHGLANRTASSVVIFLSISTLWNILFSPIYGSLPTLVLTMGLGMVLTSSQGSRQPPDGAPAVSGQRTLSPLP
ncbi:MAG: O-antigen ligase family protein, partial [Leifsonia sp.]